MADIELVIKIPEEEYEEIINSEDCGLHRLTRAVAKGMPLPKGHGDLIDVNRKITVPVYDEQYEEWEEKILTVREALNRWSNEGIGVKDVVILADKEQKS